jgi:adenine-specific DNA-methyltransferase
MSRPLDNREQQRLAAQETLDQQKSVAERNRLGQFATPAPLSLDMALLAKQLLPVCGPVRFLDPGIGSGVFFYASRKTLGAARLRSALGFDLDPGVAAVAGRLWGEFGLHVRAQDFCLARPPTDEKSKATLVICNPPYVRHHHLSAAQKAVLRREIAAAGFRVSGLAGLYCYFLLLAHRWLALNGVSVWIMPAEFLDVNYGQALKDYLVRRVTLHRIHRFDPEDVQFADALVSSVVLAFVNRPPPTGHHVELTSGGHLLEPQLIRAVALAKLDPTAKWGPLFSGPPSIRSAGNGALTVGDLFVVKRGLATGANDYFILPRRQARELRLPERFLRPILPGPRNIPDSGIDRASDGFPAGLPELVLLDCDLPMEEIRRQYPDLAWYLGQGEKQGIAQRYLPAHRPLWYKQEQRPPPPILCTYMGRQNGGRAIRFIRNRSEATAPNVYLLLYPKPALAAACRNDAEVIDRLFGALGEIANGLARGGRIYGGGLNKIEPRELAAMELPEWVRQHYGHLRREGPDQLDLFAASGE